MTAGADREVRVVKQSVTITRQQPTSDDERHLMLSSIRNPISRRYFLRECGYGTGKIALASLLTGALSSKLGAVPGPAANPLAPRQPHFPGKAKSVIHLFMAGAPIQLELFDYKPRPTPMEGEP